MATVYNEAFATGAMPVDKYRINRDFNAGRETLKTDVMTCPVTGNSEIKM